VKFLIEDDAVRKQAGNLGVTLDELQGALQRYRAVVGALPGAWEGAGIAVYQEFDRQFQVASQELVSSLQTMQTEVDAAGLAYNRDEANQKAAVDALTTGPAPGEPDGGGPTAGELALIGGPALLGGLAVGLKTLNAGKWLGQTYGLQQGASSLARARAMFGAGPRAAVPTPANSPITRKLLEKAFGPNALRVLNHPVVAGTTPSQSLLKGSLKSLPARAGLARGLGVAGSAYATGASLVNVVSQGNPVDAFQENGMHYVSDVAELGFNASMTAFMVAPSPWTAGAAAVTGLAYGVTEIIANREAIGEFLGDAGEAIGDFASDAVDTVTDTIGNVAGALNPFD
jgi:uncharacterized protein YukE